MKDTLPPVLYHYTKRNFAEDFVTRGVVSFGNSANYDEHHLTVAQRDAEHVRTAVLSGDRAKLRTGPSLAESVEIRKIISLKFEVRLPTYFLKCMTLERNDARFFPEFKADTCIRIREPYELLNRMCAALDQGQLLGDWQIIGDIAKYRRSDEVPPVEEEKQFFLKDIGYAWQKEFRIVLRPCFMYIPKSKDAREELHIEPLVDICDIL